MNIRSILINERSFIFMGSGNPGSNAAALSALDDFIDIQTAKIILDPVKGSGVYRPAVESADFCLGE
jgi:hypothetical protein